MVKINHVTENKRDSKQLITEFHTDYIITVDENDGHQAPISNPVDGWINVIVPQPALPAKYRLIQKIIWGYYIK